jgi:hypothetical protein
MNKVILILLPFLFFNNVNAQETAVIAGHDVTFKLKITDPIITDSIAIRWIIEPYMESETVVHRSLFPKSTNTDGLYQQTIIFPDSLMGKTITYRYEAAQGRYDLPRLLVLEKNKVPQKIETWGYFEVLEGKGYPLKADVESIDGIMKAYYEIMSGPAGEPINIQRDKSLHYKNALILFSITDNNKIYNEISNVSDIHKMAAKTKSGIWEYEIERDTHQYGNIANVWSTFGIKEKVDGTFKEKGVSSVQLYHDGNRWWILSWLSQSEKIDSLTQKYINKK